MLRQLLALSLLISSLYQGSAQTTTLVANAEGKTISINYDLADTYTEGVLDIIDKTDGPKAISYSIKEHHEIIKNGAKLMVRVYVGNLLRIDDYKYLQFDINELLTPNFISATYEFKSANGTVLKSEEISNAIFKSGAPLVKFSFDSFEDEENSSINLSNISFSFSKKNLKTLDQHIQIINSYYDVDAQLSLMNKELDQMVVDSIGLLEENLQIIQENTEALVNIKSMRFASKLQLAANDPLGYKTNYGQSDVRNKQIKKELEHQLKYMHETYYKKGVSNLTWGDTARANDLFLSSINKKINYAPPYCELAYIDLSMEKYGKAIDSCQMIISQLNPDNDTRYKTIKLAEKIIYLYIDSIEYFIDNQEFEQAVEKLNQTLAYADDIEGLRKFAEFDAIYSKLYLAYYNQLVVQTETLLAENLLIEAHENIDSMSRFRLVHMAYIKKADKEYELQNKLYTAWIEKGKIAKNNGQPNNALIAFTKARKLCHDYKKVLCTEELAVLLQESRQAYYGLMLVDAQKAIDAEYPDSALNILAGAKETLFDWKLEPDPMADTLFLAANQIKYEQYIFEGDMAFLNYDSRRALAFYNQAVELSERIKLTTNLALSAKISEAATASIVMYCDHGSTQIDALQINKAYHYLDKAKTLAEHYNLMGNPEVSIAIEILEAALNTGECNKAIHEFNIQMTAANKFIKQKQFGNATKALEKGISLSKNYEECTVPDSLAIQLKTAIYPIKNYMTMIAKSSQLVEQNSYDGCISNYINAEKYYQDSIADNYEIEHVLLFDYIKNDRSDGLRDFAIRYYAEQKETGKALDLLYLLYKVDYNSNWAKKSQIALGVQLAQNDFEEDPNQNIDRKIMDYTKNDHWFNHLKKAYLAQWKKL